MEMKKVYVETTVVSDATALPARDVVQLGRQLITKEWWQTASEWFYLLSLANAYGWRIRMTTKVQYDEGLEEIWRIKREIAAEYPTLDDYFKGMAAYREERKRNGTKLVQLVPFSAKPVADEPRPHEPLLRKALRRYTKHSMKLVSVLANAPPSGRRFDFSPPQILFLCGNDDFEYIVRRNHYVA